MPASEAEELLSKGSITDAIAAIKQQIAKRQSDPDLRFFFFQLMAMTGRWDEARIALNVVADQDSEQRPLITILQMLLDSEKKRAAVFSGRELPLLFGEPQEFMSWYALANQMGIRGEFEPAKKLRAQAMAAAPDTPGTVNDRPFEGFFDADDGLGPMLETVVSGQYFWIPFCNIQTIEISPPKALHEAIWLPAIFTFINRGSLPGFIPVRYAGSEKSADGEILRGWKTDWTEQPDGRYTGLGQRVFRTGGEPVAVLDARAIEFTAPAKTGGTP